MQQASPQGSGGFRPFPGRDFQTTRPWQGRDSQHRPFQGRSKGSGKTTSGFGGHRSLQGRRQDREAGILATLRYKAQESATDFRGQLQYDGRPAEFYNWKERLTHKIEHVKLVATRNADREISKRTTRDHTPNLDEIYYIRKQELEVELGNLMQNVIDGLRGDASQVALDIGLRTVGTPAGAEQLLKDMEKAVFPEIHEEARDLYKAGTREHPYGHLLSRQPTEPMRSYIKRRERWHQIMKNSDVEKIYNFTDRQLGELLLNNAGLKHQERLLILASIRNSKDFEHVKKALIEQHPHIHMQNTGRIGDRDGDRDSRPTYRGKQHGRRFQRTANLGVVD